MNFLLFLLFISIILNFIFFYIDIYPFLFKKFSKQKYCKEEAIDTYLEKVFRASFRLAFSNKTIMKMTERNDVISRTHLFLNRKKFNKFKKFSYPRAFLFLGLLKFISKKESEDTLSKIKIRFNEQYLLRNGQPSFEIDKVDQTVFALAALELLAITGEKKYKTFADSFYYYLCSLKSENGVIPYRKNSKVQYVDLIGMICPFLIDYGLKFNKQEALNRAYLHINYWIDKGLDTESHLPFHCIHNETGTKVGPTNWGRGIAWYGLGLSHVVHNTNKDNNPFYGKFLFELNSLLDRLESLKNNNSLWGQFPGNPDGNGLYFDASASTTFLYMNVLVNRKTDFQTEICKYTTSDGYINFTSGDTEGISQYSNAYSKSEFSQGMLLLYLSKLKNLK